ncbi:DNA polymerase III subunit gamma/tau [Candidatus Saccharibacteria bacterium]|nr:DNA polymerase III subunit gamma/tau [Candidatus Saccharibacteria bacterium]
MKNLYRRERPLSLGEVIGQPQVTKPLMAALKAGKVSHAYLFVGPRGCGKTSVARILAHEVNGFSYEVEDDYVDIIEIDGASNRGIDNIRELREKAAIAPTMGKYKVYIIDEVHMLTKEAFNALLKTLEEPPEHVIFIMATTDAYKVPVTITSRAQTYTFQLASRQTMFDFLKSVCQKEKIKISDEALKLVVKRGGGSFRDSLSLLDQISTLSDEEITKELVEKAIGLPEDEKIAELITNYLSGDVVKITTSLKELLSSGIKAETIAEELITTIIDNPEPITLPLLARLPDVKAPFAEARLLVALCDGVTLESQRREVRSAAARVLAPAARGDGPAGRAPERDSSVRTPSQDQNDASTEEVERSPANITHGKFDWNGFLEKVKGMNDAVYSQVAKAGHNVSGSTLEIYPEKKIAKTILSRANNKKILIDAANGLEVKILDAGENPNAKKDELISKISGIMGGEVQNDGGGNPF